MKNHIKSFSALLLAFACLPVFAQIVVDTQSVTTGNTSVSTSSGVSTSTPTPNPDMVITKSIQTKFLEDKTIAGLNILVVTTNGAVILQGTVDDPQQLSHAIELAKSVNGVNKVESKLTIKGVGP